MRSGMTHEDRQRYENSPGGMNSAPVYAAPVAYEFLSPDWIAAMRKVRADFADRKFPHDFAANVTITNAPFDEPTICGHIDTTGPTPMIETGHLNKPDFSIQMPYELALDLFVRRETGAVMQALFSGAVRVTGDSSKLLMLAGELTPPPPGDPRRGELRELARRVDEITAGRA